jgi:protein SCO1/2
MIRRAGYLTLLLLWWSVSATAAPDLREFAYRQMPGNRLALDAMLRDEAGQAVRLGSLLGTQPVILALGYYHCPNLCGIVRNDLIDALSRSGLAVNSYELILLSIDPSETAKDANAAKQQDIRRTQLTAMPASWHYLTGSAENLRLIEDAVGFRSRFDADVKQFLHPAGLVFLTPQGTVSSYLLGVGYQPGDVRLAVRRAATGAVSQTSSPVLLFCYHYDPTTGRYTLSILKVLELSSILTIATAGSLIGWAIYRDRPR